MSCGQTACKMTSCSDTLEVKAISTISESNTKWVSLKFNVLTRQEPW